MIAIFPLPRVMKEGYAESGGGNLNRQLVTKPIFLLKRHVTNHRNQEKRQVTPSEIDC